MDINKHQDLLTINWNLIFSVITVLVLILILKHFFFEKVKKFMDERKAQVAEQRQTKPKIKPAKNLINTTKYSLVPKKKSVQ